MKEQTTTKKLTLGKRIALYTGRFFLWLFATLAVLIAGLYIMLMYINKGPSPYVRDLFVASVMESSAGGILSSIFLSEEEIAAIQEKNNTELLTEVTDTTLINVVAAQNSASENSADSGAESLPSEEAFISGDGIEIFEVHGSTYNGLMMVVEDPSRVKVGVIDYFSLDTSGETLETLVNEYDCIAGINGGKYDDENGLGSGGMPEGIVISEGRLLLGDPDTIYDVYGFNNEDVLIVGSMTAAQAVSMGIRDAVSFGPALIVNGRAAGYSGVGSGLNPRTAIGQRADGAVLLLVIAGRQANSMGASMADLIEVMQEYGAVNAANLDGGMSSSMYYDGEELISSCTIRSARRIPTAFLVERRSE
ncbi:MAG: phosphodiester glycosidase family protein [Lachnospiraceae bacterium]|nr:phosphodiester glycosidase family protein [Lachnospiraceae bacterium]